MESAASLPGEVLHRWQGRELETPADSETPPASPSSDVSLSLRDSNRLAFERNQSAIQIAGIEAVSLPVVRTTAPTPPPGTAHADFAEAWASIQIKPSPLGQNSKADSVLQQGLSDVRPGDESASQPAPRLEESDADLIDRASPRDYGGYETDTDDEDGKAALAPLRGLGVPTISYSQRLPGEPSQITDLGEGLYTMAMLERTTSSLPISYDGTQGDLQRKLFAEVHKILRQTGGDRGFLPRHKLDKLVYQESVETELARIEASFRNRLRKSLPFWRTPATESEIHAMARKICELTTSTGAAEYSEQLDKRSFRKIFAILLLIERPSKIWNFVEEGVSDADLPLVKIQRKSRPWTFKLRRKEARHTSLQCFKGWRHSTIARFEEWQWAMLAPYFARGTRKDVKHYTLPDETILPFTSWENKREPGGFGQVYKVSIHPDHHNFGNQKESKRGFAVKRLFSRKEADFRREVKILKRLSGDSHPHLISLLATYKYRGEYYLIFHWAEADLLGYWEKINPSPNKDLDTVKWLIQQCRGIAEALSKVHRYDTDSNSSLLHPEGAPQVTRESNGAAKVPITSGNPVHMIGRHGDIKPENLLYFPNGSKDGRGTLKITDFGIAEFSTHDGRPSRDGNGYVVPNSPSYRAPECDLPGSMISCSYDMWTLGCLYLEFVAWYFGGWAYVQEFRGRRRDMDQRWGMKTDTFFTIRCPDPETRCAVVKPSVTEFIEELHQNPCCTEYFHDFLSMIEHDMVIVEPISQTETGHRRLTSNQVHTKLAKLHQECCDRPGYATNPAAWRTTSQSSAGT
ncbi:Kinase-like protein [Pleurostoma richardsiae]|uniref:Kinase-like protein n=1 Tax=Pleurostoma richardsiae TaxID=41990 RepID=A0AA38VFC8_9PEZI|nr:Kinase-like protein [Pleurostoma richardsiae]